MCGSNNHLFVGKCMQLGKISCRKGVDLKKGDDKFTRSCRQSTERVSLPRSFSICASGKAKSLLTIFK